MSKKSNHCLAIVSTLCKRYGLSPQSWTQSSTELDTELDKIQKFIAIPEHPLAVEGPIFPRTPTVDRPTAENAIVSTSIHVCHWPVGQPLVYHLSTVDRPAAPVGG